MYCPQYATSNADGTKFCRSCGQELEVVALALRNKSTRISEASRNETNLNSPQNWLEKHDESKKKVFAGTGLLAGSLLMAIALALFLPVSFDAPWILVWTVLFGWLACWGFVEIGKGIGGMLESKSKLSGMAGVETAIDAKPEQWLSDYEPPTVTNTSAAAVKSSSPGSVTEGTTRNLNDFTEDKRQSKNQR